MLNKVEELAAAAIETAVKKVEEYDPEAKERTVIYGQEGNSAEQIQEPQQEENKNAPEQQKQENGASDQAPAVKQVEQFDRLKIVTGDLIDLWLYEGSKGLKYVQESQAYKFTDPYINYLEKYELVKEKSLTAIETISKTKTELSDKVVLFYDEATARIGMLVKVLSERQTELLEYLQKSYSNTQVFVQDNWLRLDFNKDGSVSSDDIRRSASEFYQFIKDYDYIEASTQIKSKLYEEALKYMNKDPETNKSKDDIDEFDEAEPEEKKEEQKEEKKEQQKKETEAPKSTEEPKVEVAKNKTE